MYQQNRLHRINSSKILQLEITNFEPAFRFGRNLPIKGKRLMQFVSKSILNILCKSNKINTYKQLFFVIQCICELNK